MNVDLSDGLEQVPVLVHRDSEVVMKTTFQYCPDNIQGPGCSVDPCEITLPGCSCLLQSCCSDSCSCFQAHGQTYSSTETLLDISAVDNSVCTPVYECNVLCSCSDTCSNRVVQRGVRRSLEVFATDRKGWGVRTLEAIPSGTFVCEYAGEVIGFEEARNRQLSPRCEKNNYIIAVREHAGPGSIVETFVDPTTVGNVGRFLNHSCQPNLFMMPVRVHSVVPRLALFSRRNIDAQEELTFDYSGGHSLQTSGEIQSGTAESKAQRKVCYCGADTCATFLPLDLTVLRLETTYHPGFGSVLQSHWDWVDGGWQRQVGWYCRWEEALKVIDVRLDRTTKVWTEL